MGVPHVVIQRKSLLWLSRNEKSNKLQVHLLSCGRFRATPSMLLCVLLVRGLRTIHEHFKSCVVASACLKLKKKRAAHAHKRRDLTHSPWNFRLQSKACVQDDPRSHNQEIERCSELVWNSRYLIRCQFLVSSVGWVL